VIGPPHLDPKPILDALERNAVDYVVIGAVAAQLHGARIERTYDIDITPAGDAGNLERLARALREIGAKLRPPGIEEGFEIEIDERTFLDRVTITFTTEHGWLDVSLVPDGTTGFEDLVRNRSTVQGFGSAVPVASLADIIRSKQAAGRPTDVVHIPILRERLLELQGPRQNHDSPTPGPSAGR
jgi:hypothetical protein